MFEIDFPIQAPVAPCDDDAKQTVHTLMERGSKLYLEFKNRQIDGSCYLLVESDRTEGIILRPLMSTIKWILSYVMDGVLAPIPASKEEEEDISVKEFSKDMLIEFLTNNQVVKFMPLYKNSLYISGKLKQMKGSINFRVEKNDEFVDWLRENEYAA